jgi:predicted small secreted protein
MKIALLLSIACAALAFSGCSTSSGASEDIHGTSTGAAQSTPPATDPSLPQDPNIGPQMVPP